MSRVVNLRHEPYDVYIGRAGRGKDGYFGNPVVVGRPCIVCDGIHSSGGATLHCYNTYARDRCTADPEFRERVKGLLGKVLGCFCKPSPFYPRSGTHPCHGDILHTLAQELNET